MTIKKFFGHTLKDATEQMKQDLGPDAIILNSRKVARGGAFNFLGKEVFEVTAAIDELPATQLNSYSRRRMEDSFDRRIQESGGAAGADNPIESLKRVAERFERRSPSERDGFTGGKRLMETADLHELKNEMLDMKGTLKDIVDQLKYSRMPSLPDHLRKAFATLVEHDVDERLAADLVQAVYAKLNPEQLNNKQLTEASLLSAMASLLKGTEEGKTRRKKARVVALVGPTGVGKTTTIAKLAAINKLMNRLDVGLISADTYRIGAIEQLRTFAAIADIPMEVVYKPAEMSAALKKFRDKDLVFIDTVGRSQRSKKELQDLARFVSAAEPDEIHLVLSASSSVKTSLDIINQFKVVKPNRLLFSKLDEAVTLGSLLSVAQEHRLPMSYVTTGQTVPDDILAVEPSQVASMVYTGVIAHA